MAQIKIKRTLAILLVLTAFSCVSAGQNNNRQTSNPPQSTNGKQPNILFIMGDDIGWMQPGIYHRGLMVGETPNIDRIGQEGAMFVDYVAMQSCTSGRNAFFTGMYPLELFPNKEEGGLYSKKLWRKLTDGNPSERRASHESLNRLVSGPIRRPVARFQRHLRGHATETL